MVWPVVAAAASTTSITASTASTSEAVSANRRRSAWSAPASSTRRSVSGLSDVTRRETRSRTRGSHAPWRPDISSAIWPR